VKSFLHAVSGLVFGVLSGYDRLVFQGHLRSLCRPGNMAVYCHTNGVLLKDFKQHSQAVTEKLIAAAEAPARANGRPIVYLRSPKMRKEDLVRDIARRDGISAGLIAVLTCVEPCWSFTLRGRAATKKLEFRPEARQCLHVYHYYQHPVFGFMYARLQTWFPFTIQMGLNGREWLGRQLDAAAVSYRRHDNCFTWLQDVERAQALLAEQLRMNWPAALDEVRAWVHPSYPELLGKWSSDYYWTLRQSEWATDVLFRDRDELQRRYGRWLGYAIGAFRSPDVLRYLGQKVPAHGEVHGKFTGEVLSDLGTRMDGLRIKHRVGTNSIKMYDKLGQVLRVETTINDPSRFKVYRAKEGEPDGPKDWRALRSGVADVGRRAEVSQKANERYLEGLAAVEHPQPLKELTEDLSRRVREPGPGGRRLRGLNLLAADDAALLAAVGRPEHAVNGFRNRDVVAALYGDTSRDTIQRKRHSARVTRLLRLLRGHAIIRKVAKTHRYQVTEKGRRVVTAILAARNASTEKLVSLAA
jgi:hypothetical protein